MSHAVIELFHWHMACGTVLLKPYIGHINIIQFLQKKLLQYRTPLTVANLILKKVWFDNGSCPKSANNDTLWVHLFFANQTWVLRIPNTAINKVIEVKMYVNIL